MTADWTIWAFRYARSDMPRDFFGGTLVNSNKGRINNPMVYSLIHGGEPGAERPILIDTGMKGDWSPSGKTYENVEHPDTILAKVGFAPEDIEDVILTHLHFDHAGNLDRFPNATFHVQRAEYEGWKQVYELPGGLGSDTTMWPLSSMQKKDLDAVEALLADGRVNLLDGDTEFAPGVWCRLAFESHTFGCQWIEVQTSGGPYVVAGDCVYWYENIERMWPPAYVQGNTWNLIKVYRAIRDAVNDETDRVVPGHDPELFLRHPVFEAGHHPVAEIHLAEGQNSRVS